MNFFRPNRSEIAPMSGAIIAVAIKGAVTVRLVRASAMWKAAASTGRIDCVHHMFRKVTKPALKTARLRRGIRAGPVLEPTLKDGNNIAGLRQCKKRSAIFGREAAIIPRDPYIAFHGPIREAAGNRNSRQGGHVRTE